MCATSNNTGRGMLVVDCHTHHTQHRQVNSSLAPLVPAASVAGMPKRTSCVFVVLGKKVPRRCRGATAASAADVDADLAPYGELDLGLSARASKAL